MNRVLTILAAAFIVAAGAVLLGRTTPRITPARAAATSDITIHEGTCNQPGAHCKSVYGHNPTGFGARLVFSLPISSPGGQAIREKGECVFLNPRSRQYLCSYNIKLTNGEVSIQGALPWIPGAAVIPITGGTGTYEGAYGTLTSLASARPTYRLHIVTP